MSHKVTLGNCQTSSRSSDSSLAQDDHSHTTLLTFDLLEDVMSMAAVDRDDIIATADVHRIGPLVEYAYYDYDNFEKKVAPVFVGDELLFLVRTLGSSGLSSLSHQTNLQPKRVEFIRAPQSNREFGDARWIAFCKRAENAGIAAGFARGFVAGLTGALQEMVSNIFEHSESPGSSLVGYKWQSNELEYTIADSGLGVLESLRTNPDYGHLHDAGLALEIALREGESRYGRNIGRGFGFRDLLYNIASRNGYLRFRSGDHSLTIDGTGVQVKKIIKQCPFIRGFLISIVAFQKMPQPS